MRHTQVYAAEPARTTPAAPSPRSERVSRSERERSAKALRIAMLAAGWSDGMLARALLVSKSFARQLRTGTRALRARQLATLMGFDKLGAALRDQQ